VNHRAPTLPAIYRKILLKLGALQPSEAIAASGLTDPVFAGN